MRVIGCMPVTGIVAIPPVVACVMLSFVTRALVMLICGVVFVRGEGCRCDKHCRGGEETREMFV